MYKGFLMIIFGVENKKKPCKEQIVLCYWRPTQASDLTWTSGSTLQNIATGEAFRLKSVSSLGEFYDLSLKHRTSDVTLPKHQFQERFRAHDS